MCGINGISESNEEVVKLMNVLIKDRGPDNSNIYSDNKVSLGHNRLKIIDLDDRSNQPMRISKNNKEIIIIFNGEIYNYMDIKEELKNKGYSFKTNSDTEVLGNCYLEYGLKIFERLNGMWAFVIYDKNKKKLILSRDRFGIKPLFYKITKNKLIFSSDLKSIKKASQFYGENIKIRKESLLEYLLFRDAIYDKTFYEEVFEVKPSHYMVYDLDKKRIVAYKRYYDIFNDKLIKIPKNFSSRLKKLEKLIKKSIKYRNIADVKVGSILSGGLDSSIVTYELSKVNNDIRTFTVGFKNGYDEDMEASELISEELGLKNSKIIIDESTFFKANIEYLKSKSLPIGVANEIALYLLSKKIKKEKYRVVLSGEGSDEIFYGYGRLFQLPLKYFESSLKDVNWLPNNFLDILIKKYFYIKNENILKTIMGSDFITKYKKRISKNIINELSKRVLLTERRYISYFLIKYHLPILLKRVDNSTMSNSIEARVPFLDHNLVEYAFNLPDNNKIKWKDKNIVKFLSKNPEYYSEVNDIPKYILKKYAERILPKRIVYRKKIGFWIPFNHWKESLIKENEKINEKIDEIKQIKIKKKYLDDIRESIEKTENHYKIQNLWFLNNLLKWLILEEN